MKVININKLTDVELSKIIEKADFSLVQRKKLQTRILTDKNLDLTLAGRKETIKFVNEEKNIDSKPEKNTNKLSEDI